VLTLW